MGCPYWSTRFGSRSSYVSLVAVAASASRTTCTSWVVAEGVIEHACVRYKSSIGAARRSRTPGGPLTKAWSACHVSNAMADRGRPDSHPNGRGTITDGRLTVQAESCHNTGRNYL